MFSLWLLFAAVLLYLFYFDRKRRELPPGPFALPLVGNFPQIIWGMIFKKSMIDLMHDYHQRYGPVFTMWWGPMCTVSLTDFELAQEVMVKNGGNFADRNMPAFASIISDGKGIVMSNGQFWQEQRRFTLHALRNLGMGRNQMEHHILEEFNSQSAKLDEQLASAGGRVVIEARSIFEEIVLNTINRMLFSNAFDEETLLRFRELKHAMDRLQEDVRTSDFVILSLHSKFPNVSFVKNRVQKFFLPQLDLIDFLRGQLKERKDAIASGEHVLEGEGNDFVDSYLIQIEKEKNVTGSSFSDESLVFDLNDLWFAGQETTDTTLSWGFIYLLLHPEVAQKVREEISTVTGGNNRQLALNDRAHTVYYNAVVLEILRLSAIISVNLWRDTTEDTVIAGYRVPKGTAVAAQMSIIMSDPKVFKNPKEFNPDRFIENERLSQYVIAFGIGKRACLGEALARAEVYLIIGNMLQRYNFSIDPAAPPEMAAIDENMRKPKKFNLIVEKI